MSENTRFDSAVGKNGRTIIGRLKPGTDLITGLEAVCAKHGVKYAYLGSSIGLLAKMSYFVPEYNSENKKIGVKYGKPNIVDEPVEMIGIQGLICQDENGNYQSHLHGTGVKLNKEVVGGHITKGGNIVMATIDFVLNEASGIELLRKYDEETDFVMLYPIQKEE